jgi:hypothetical protein
MHFIRYGFKIVYYSIAPISLHCAERSAESAMASDANNHISDVSVSGGGIASPWAVFPSETYPRHDACEAWRFAWLASGIDPPHGN